MNDLFKDAIAKGIDPALIRAAAAEAGVDLTDEDLPEIPLDQAIEMEGAQKLDLLAKAAEMGLPQELIDAAAEEMGMDVYRAKLELDQERANAEQAQAAYNLEAAEDTVGENLLESVAQAGQEVGNAISFIPDTITGAANRAFGTEIPTVNEGLESIGAPFRIGGDEQYVEEPFARESAKASGVAGLFGLAGAPVAGRNLGKAGATGVMAEFLGLGTGDDIALQGTALIERMGAEQAADLAKLSPEARVAQLSEIDLNNSFQVSTVAQREADEFVYNENLRQMDALMAHEADVMAFNDKWAKAADSLKEAQATLRAKGATADEIKKAKAKERAATERLQTLEAEGLEKLKNAPKAGRSLDEGVHNAASNGLADRYGISFSDASRAIIRSGGVEKRASFKALDDAVAKNVDDLYDGTADVVRFGEKLIRPATALMRDKVGQGSARNFERAFESSARDSEKLLRKYISRPDTLKGLREWMGRSDNKADFLNLGHQDYSSTTLLKEISERARKELTKDQYNMFRDILADTRMQNKRAARLYKDEVLQDKIYWTAKFLTKDDNSLVGRIKQGFNPREADPKSVDTTEVRRRGDARLMSQEQLDMYENPLIAQIDRFNEESMMLNLSENFNLRPALGLGDNSNQFFNELERQVTKAAGAEKGALARGIAEDTYKGSRKKPPRAIELFMKQSYAGTLGQVDSAMMNLHDVFVSAWRNGTVPTAKAVLETLRRDKDFDIRELGIGNDATSLEEFRSGIASKLEDMSKLEKGIDWYSEKAFKYSGFQAADRFGKGVTLRAAKYAFEDSAKAGTLAADFGHLATAKEWAQLRPGLKAGQKLSEYTPKQQELLEKVMFARLGEQQLISMAGRPLAYLQNPKFRPFWAMSGFAIKQADMLKMAVIDEAKKGNYAKAGQNAAEYMAFVAIGYSVVDTLRNLPAYMITGDDRKAPSAERMAARVIEQPMAAATLNKLGSPEDVKRMLSDPTGFAFGTVEPPGGAIGNVSKDVGRLLSGKEFKGYFLKSIPYGDFIYDLANAE